MTRPKSENTAEVDQPLAFRIEANVSDEFLHPGDRFPQEDSLMQQVLERL